MLKLSFYNTSVRSYKYKAMFFDWFIIIDEEKTIYFFKFGTIIMNNFELISRLWNLCNLLRDDGITFHQYLVSVIQINDYIKQRIRANTAS
jgi:hypothetical protein